MKKFSLLLFALVTAVALTSCNNVEKILPKKDGNWKVTNVSEVNYTDGVQTSDTSYVPADQVYMFSDDGTGMVTEGGSSESFTWSYDKDKDQITLTDAGTSFSLVIDVLESKSKTQQWLSSFEIEFLGVVARSESTIDLERQ